MRFLHSIQLTNLLSFGPDSPPIELGPLNVLIGANASGKSNLIAAIDLLRCLPTPGAFGRFLEHTGGLENWHWKGASGAAPKIRASVFDRAQYHEFGFGHGPATAHVTQEAIGGEQADEYRFDRRNDSPIAIHDNGEVRSLDWGAWTGKDSILAQLRDSVRYPAITRLALTYPTIRIFRPWSFPDAAPPRIPQLPTVGTDFLNENADNLAVVLNELELHSNVSDRIASEMGEFYEAFKRFAIVSQGGATHLFIHEESMNSPIPAQRLSDGTLRYLGLLTILCHPAPPPLICIEEPELGLHPDVMPNLAKLMIQASERTQLIVTTHSQSLVDAFSDNPDCVLVCEKEKGSTVVQRLNKDDLSNWLKNYSLGRLWRQGALGGNRW